jgi:hypothetical protein
MAITRFPLETDQPVVEVTLPPGRHVLELVVEDSAGLRSEPDTVTITIENILPVISGINPAGARQGAESVTATIRGLNLENVQAVSFADGGITVEDFTENSPAELQVVLSVDPDAAPGPRRFRVTTAAGSVDSPAGVIFTVATASPVITAIVPDSGPQGAQNRKVVIQGSNLIKVESVRFVPESVGITPEKFITVSEIVEQIERTKLLVFLNIHLAAKLGPYRFTVNTTHGSAESPRGVVFKVTSLREPTVRPTIGPTVRPTIGPTIRPTVRPTIGPTVGPTIRPTVGPTVRPTVGPTIRPTVGPTIRPTIRPTVGPTLRPTVRPIIQPTIRPIIFNARDFPGRNVQEVKGIGPVTAERLKKKRITNLAHLASTEPGKLAEILDISEVRAMAFIDEARRLLTIEE